MENTLTASQEAEFKLCAESFTYFCENHIKVVHPKLGLVPLKLHDFQKRYVEHISTNRLVIAKKFRQGGFSTVNMAWLLWRLLFKLDERNMMLFKTDGEITRYHSWVFKRMIENLPDFLKPEFGKFNAHRIDVPSNNTSIEFYTPEASCGRQIDHLFIEEAAFIKDMDQHWKAMWPCISFGRNCVITSTPNGKGNWFHLTYIDAVENKNNFSVFEASYTEHPEYKNEAWAEEMKKNLGERGWRQEVLAEFWGPEDDEKEKKEEKEVKEDDLLDLMKQHTKKLAETSEDFFFVKTLKEEQEKLRECRRKAYEQSKGNKFDFVSGNFGYIRDNKEPPKLSHEKLWEDNGKYPITMVTFDDIQRPQSFRGYYWSNVAEEIAEEHIFVDDDHSLESAIKTKKQNLQDLEDRVNQEVYSDDLLVLAGVLGEGETTGRRLDKFNGENASVDVLKRVLELGSFPENLKVTFSDKKLCVNGAATNINEFDLCCLYNGLVAFTSHEKAVTKIAKLICKRMMPLFGLRKDN